MRTVIVDEPNKPNWKGKFHRFIEFASNIWGIIETKKGNLTYVNIDYFRFLTPEPQEQLVEELHKLVEAVIRLEEAISQSKK